MKKSKCKVKGCPNFAIAFSKYCGQHTSNKVIKSALKNYKGKTFKNLDFSFIEIKKIVFKNKVFLNCKFIDIEFHFVHFEECHFKDCYFSNIKLEDTNFLSSKFSSCDFHNAEFEACFFDNLISEASVFTECSFYESDIFKNAIFNNSVFIGSNISDQGQLNNAKFNKTRILQTTINDCDFENSDWLDCEFKDVILLNNNFKGAKFYNLNHDFGLSSFPKLNDFSLAEINETSIPRNIKKWNLFRGTSERFLLGLAENIGKEQHPNNLSILTAVLENLDKIGYKPDVYFINRIGSIFKNQFDRAATKSDFRTVGEVISEYGRIPYKYKVTGFALPAPKDRSISKKHEACLIIQFDLKTWTIQNVHQLFFYMNELTQLLPSNNSQIEVSDILKGSLFQTLWGDIKQLAATGRLLDIEKMEIEIENKKLENELKKIELEIQRESLKTIKEENSMRLRKSMLENADLELDVAQKRLNILTAIEKMEGLNYAEFLESSNGIAAQQISQELKKLVPVLSLKLKILDS